jgi:hypothetical protein
MEVRKLNHRKKGTIILIAIYFREKHPHNHRSTTTASLIQQINATKNTDALYLGSRACELLMVNLSQVVSEPDFSDSMQLGQQRLWCHSPLTS